MFNRIKMFLLIFGVMLLTILYFKIMRKKSKFSTQEKYIFITGCDTGMGNALALYLASKGFYIFATYLLSPPKNLISKMNIITIHMDVTRSKSVENAFVIIRSHLEKNGGELYAIVNNAGVLVYGEYDWLSWNQVQLQVEVNLLGMMRVTKTALPLLRKCKGRILNVSSVNSICPFPGISVYSATKSAVESFSHSIRNELFRLGVKVIIMQPGDFIKVTNLMANQKNHASHMWQLMSKEDKDFYSNYFHHYQNMVEKNAGATSFLHFNESSLFRDFEDALTSDNPKILYRSTTLGFRIFYFILPFLPESFMDIVWDFIQTRMFRKNLMNKANSYHLIFEMTLEKKKWLNAGHHHEHAAEMLNYVEAKCPARIDFQGGWSDTPPICYEIGGCVVNAGITLSGKKPIEVKGRLIPEMKIELEEILSGVKKSHSTFYNISDFRDYDNPSSTGALCKATLIFSRVINLNCSNKLEEQLAKIGGGISLICSSSVPQGSGLGTSSILIAAILSVIWTLCGKKFTHSDLIHAVLQVEQLLTTGGGWQDQVGGVLGGICKGYCKPLRHGSELVEIESERINISPSALSVLNAHIILVYTGTVRLARSIVQVVIRNWKQKNAEILTAFKNMSSQIPETLNAISSGNMEELGRLLNDYWNFKKTVAPGCEPLQVAEIMAALKPFVFGQTLLGAGGGGFLLAITKEPNAKKEFFDFILKNISGCNDLSWHNVEICLSGLELYINGQHVTI